MKNALVKLATFYMQESLYGKKLVRAYVQSHFFFLEVEIYTPDKYESQKLFAAEIT